MQVPYYIFFFILSPEHGRWQQCGTHDDVDGNGPGLPLPVDVELHLEGPMGGGANTIPGHVAPVGGGAQALVAGQAREGLVHVHYVAFGVSCVGGSDRKKHFGIKILGNVET